ncbi:hypothetical protein [Brevundimonas sp.]|uniref:hypothetical protein n=1 Tax=Brevundimonas sp. TaxID=1871086 RepID=UPI0035AF97CC
MTKRNFPTGMIIVAVAIGTTVGVLQVNDDRQDRRAAFDRGYVAATCEWLQLMYPDPDTRPSEAVEIMSLCMRWDGRLKP